MSSPRETELSRGHGDGRVGCFLVMSYCCFQILQAQLPVATFLVLGRGRLIPDDEHVACSFLFVPGLLCFLFFSFNRASSPQQVTCGPSGWLCGRLSPFARSSPIPSCRMSRLLRILESSSETKGGRYEILDVNWGALKGERKVPT